MYQIDSARLGEADRILKKSLSDVQYDNIAKLREYMHQETNKIPKLPFHGVHHIDDVFSAAVKLASREGITGNDLFVLCGGALTHDIGFAKKYWGNEFEGAQLATVILDKYGYNSNQIRQVWWLIMKTKIPQMPVSNLEKILCDADLYNLGGPEFFEVAAILKLERTHHIKEIPKEYIPPLSDIAWYETLLKFLESHQYWTQSARDLRDEGKQQNIEELQRMIQKLKDAHGHSFLRHFRRKK